MEDAMRIRRISFKVLSQLHPHEWTVLCRASKALQAVAEPVLYGKIMLCSATRIFKVCKTLAANHRLGEHVLQLLLLRDELSRSSYSSLPPEFYEALFGALAQVPNLVNFAASDRYALPSELFQDCSNVFAFQLQELVLQGVPWDKHTHELLSSQHGLRQVKFYDGPGSDYTHSLPLLEGCLPELDVFDGGLLVGMEVLSAKPPMRNLQLAIGSEEVQTQLLKVLPRLANVSGTLLGLNLTRMPEDVAVKAIDIVATCCPNLRHLGVLPWTIAKRAHLMDTLIYIHHLRSVELILARWNPAPTLPGYKALTSELRTFCPNVTHVAFWTGQHRFVFLYDQGEWQHLDLRHSRESLWNARWK